MTRPIVVMAEDYGVSHGVCDAALDLVAMGRISAIAARPGGAAFATRAGELAALEGGIGVGLTLSWGERGALPFGLGALAGRHDRDALVETVTRELEDFVRAVGRPPDFVGARAEVHTLPNVRGALFLALEIAGLYGRLWLRDPRERLGARLRRRVGFGAATLAHVGARGFAREAAARGWSTNRGYAGFLPRAPGLAVPAAYERLVQACGPAPLLVCRPAYRDATLEAYDSRAEMRERELFYLSSQRFADLMEVLSLDLVAAPTATMR